MQRARSRLASSSSSKSIEPAPLRSTSPAQTVSHRRIPSKSLVSLYQSWLPSLVFGLIWIGVVIQIVNRVSPMRLADWLLPGGYLAFQLPLFLGLLGVSTFLWRSRRRGLLTALALQTLVTLKLQAVLISPLLILMILVFFGTIELSANLVARLVQRRHHHHS